MGYLTLILIGAWVIGVIVVVVKLGIKENEYERKYGKGR